MNPISAANQLIETVESSNLPAEVKGWLSHGFKLYRAGHVKSLDEALGLAVGQGKAPERFCNAWRRQERDRLIRQADKELHGLTKCQRAKVISASMLVGIPEVESREALITLTKLRRLCMDTRGDQVMAVEWKRVREIVGLQRFDSG